MPRTAVATLPDPLRDLPTPARTTVLVIEDCDDVRRGVRELLELNGYPAIEAADGDAAIRALTTYDERIGLLLLDLQLPGRNGGSVRAVQRAIPSLAAIPVIVMSACEWDPSAASDLSADGWVEKPFRCDQLLREVRRVLPGPTPSRT